MAKSKYVPLRRVSGFTSRTSVVSSRNVASIQVGLPPLLLQTPYCFSTAFSSFSSIDPTTNFSQFTVNEYAFLPSDVLVRSSTTSTKLLELIVCPAKSNRLPESSFPSSTGTHATLLASNTVRCKLLSSGESASLSCSVQECSVMPRSLPRSLSNVLSAMATDRTISPTGAFSVTVLDPLAEQISSRTGWVESLKSTPSIPVTLCPGFSRPIGAKSFTAIPAGRFPFLPISMSTSSTLPWFVNVSSTETMRDEYRWGERTKRYSIPSPNPFTLFSSSCFLIGMKLGPTSSMPVPAPAVFVAAIGNRSGSIRSVRRGQQKWFQEPRPVAYVIVRIVAGEIVQMLTQQGRLLRVGDVQLHCQIQYLQLHNILLVDEAFDRFAQHVGCNLRHLFVVLADKPQDGGTRRRYLDEIEQLGHLRDDFEIISSFSSFICVWSLVRTKNDLINGSKMDFRSIVIEAMQVSTILCTSL
uniref:Uncharacterized protein n=1 Tax=Anopheles coluzzii TaxID=1518534 RepID=A0A8W7PTF2_ANOCL